MISQFYLNGSLIIIECSIEQLKQSTVKLVRLAKNLTVVSTNQKYKFRIKKLL